ncbi:unnamed protein product [Paramecium sonneborni]|uniref:Uncharacterized protein n=1 Tax=Paramecium sonneborni TaxID=65129 RepID=A0A8S1P3V7_9CILI|nr:unnamed protein product [Paramecium sonneborni]
MIIRGFLEFIIIRIKEQRRRLRLEGIRIRIFFKVFGFFSQLYFNKQIIIQIQISLQKKLKYKNMSNLLNNRLDKREDKKKQELNLEKIIQDQQIFLWNIQKINKNILWMQINYIINHCHYSLAYGKEGRERKNRNIQNGMIFGEQLIQILEEFITKTVKNEKNGYIYFQIFMKELIYYFENQQISNGIHYENGQKKKRNLDCTSQTILEGQYVSVNIQILGGGGDYDINESKYGNGQKRIKISGQKLIILSFTIENQLIDAREYENGSQSTCIKLTKFLLKFVRVFMMIQKLKIEDGQKFFKTFKSVKLQDILISQYQDLNLVLQIFYQSVYSLKNFDILWFTNLLQLKELNKNIYYKYNFSIL